MSNPQQNIPTTQTVIAVLWPSFLTAGIAATLFFTTFDPQLLMAVADFEPLSRIGGYTIGFFLFWLLTSSACVLTCYFQRSCHNPNEPD